MPVIVTATVSVFTLATLGDLIQIETISFVLYRQRYPKQVFNLLNLPVTVTVTIFVFTLVTLGNLTQIETMLFVLHHLR